MTSVSCFSVEKYVNLHGLPNLKTTDLLGLFERNVR